MEIEFANGDLRRQCNSEKAARRELGLVQAKKLRTRLDDLAAAVSLDLMRMLPGHCHELSQDRKGQLAISLKEPFRLIFEPAHDERPLKPDGGLDWAKVTRVRILEICNYHG